MCVLTYRWIQYAELTFVRAKGDMHILYVYAYAAHAFKQEGGVCHVAYFKNEDSNEDFLEYVWETLDERSAVIIRIVTNEEHFICLVKRRDMVVLIDSLKFAYTIKKDGSEHTHVDRLVALSKDQFLDAFARLVFDGDYAIVVRSERYPSGIIFSDEEI